MNNLAKWTCYICHQKAPEESIPSLEAQEQSKKTVILVDGDYKIYLRCLHCELLFHPSCCGFELEPVLTQEEEEIYCNECAEGRHIKNKKDGTSFNVSCTADIAKMITSDTTDPNIKQLILKNIVEASACSSSSLQIAMTPQTDNEANLPTSAQKDGDHDIPQTSKSGQSEMNRSSKDQWTPETQKLLLAKHKQIEDSKTAVKNKWNKIANEVNKYNYSFTAEQCRLKIKSLKEKYERKKKKNNKSGESPATDDEEDLEEIFEKYPDVKPVTIIESKKRPPTPSSDTDEGTSLESETTPKTKSSKNKRRAVDDMKDFLSEVFIKREEAVERRHQEKIDTVNSLIGVLREVAKK